MKPAGLHFRGHFQDAIRAGLKKTQSADGIARWVRPGESAFSPGLGWLSIQEVAVVELDKLGDEDAVADGLESIAALREVLIAFYPNYSMDGKQWFRVRFSLAEKRMPVIPWK